MSTALYRRYRPETFADVIGQEHVTEPLMTALRKNRVNHAYLFSGPRGCGKTTSARILARCLNCAQGPTDIPCGVCDSCRELARDGSGSLDVIEIDAASHGGVDDARDLRERATFAPVRDRYKVFIIDEAHMVTSAGFNALLKIVEEPPEHVLFIFATTEPDKVIGTIRSRTHHYPFRLVPPEPLLAYLERLCTEEHVTVAPGVLSLVIRAGGGSVRDTLSVLDQLMAGAGDEGLSYEMAIDLLGYTHASLLDDVVDSLSAGDATTVFGAVDRVIQTGHDPRRFVEDLLERFRDLIIVSAMEESARHVLRAVPEDAIARMQHQARQLGRAELSRAADITNAALTEMTGATSPRLHLELLCARLLLPGADAGERGVAARVDRIERRLNYADGAARSGAPGDGIAGAVEHGTTHVGLTPGAGAPAPAATDGAPVAAPTDNDAPADGGAPERPASPAGPAPARPAPTRPSAGGPSPAADPAPNGSAARPAPARPAFVGAEGSPPVADPGQDAAAPPAPARPAPSGSTDRDRGERDPGARDADSVDGRPPRTTDEPVPGPVTDPVDAQDPVDDSTDAPIDHDETPVASAPAAPTDIPEPPASRRPGGNASAESEPGHDGHDGPDAADRPAADHAAASNAAASGSPAPPSGAGDAGASDVDMVRRAWPEVLDALARSKKVAWILVSQNGTVRALRDNTLYLEFTTPGIADQFARHEDHLREALHSVLGLNTRIVALHPGAAPPHGGSGTAGAAAPPAPSAPSAAGAGRPKASAEDAGPRQRPAGTRRPDGPAGSGGAPARGRSGNDASSHPRERVWSPPGTPESTRAQGGSGTTGHASTPSRNESSPAATSTGTGPATQPAAVASAAEPATGESATGASTSPSPTEVGSTDRPGDPTTSTGGDSSVEPVGAPRPTQQRVDQAGEAAEGGAVDRTIRPLPRSADDEPPLPDEPDFDEPPFPDDGPLPGRPRAVRAESQQNAPVRPAPGTSTGVPARPAPGTSTGAPARPAPGTSTDAVGRPPTERASVPRPDSPARPAPGAGTPARPAPAAASTADRSATRGSADRTGTDGRTDAAGGSGSSGDDTRPGESPGNAGVAGPPRLAPVEDVPSDDDLVLEDSGRAGRAAAERILGAQLIDERALLRE